METEDCPNGDIRPYGDEVQTETRADTSLSLFIALSLVTGLLSVGAKGKPFFPFGLSFSGADELKVNPAIVYSRRRTSTFSPFVQKQVYVLV